LRGAVQRNVPEDFIAEGEADHAEYTVVARPPYKNAEIQGEFRIFSCHTMLSAPIPPIRHLTGDGVQNGTTGGRLRNQEILAK
jgi:hypothetical protein